MGHVLKTLLVSTIIIIIGSTSCMAGGVHPITGEPLARNQTFSYRILDKPSSIDPQLSEDVSSAEIIRDLFEGLMNQDADGNLIPGVATHFTVNKNNTVYTFYLRDNAMWSDGRSVTAHDFVYAWRRAANPATASPYAWYIELMSIEGVGDVLAGNTPAETLGVKAITNTTLEVRLSTSLPYFPLMTTHVATFPTPSWTIEAHGEAWLSPENIVSNGAYVLIVDFTQNVSIRKRNPMYWNNGATILETVITYIINDDYDALKSFFSGELDRTAVPVGKLAELKAAYPDEALVFPRLCTYYYIFNLSDSGPKAFQDVRVRQALSYAIDRDLIIGDILQGGQFAAYSFTPSFIANFQAPDAKYSAMTQDARDTKARQLLAEAGYGTSNPLSFTLLFNTSQGHSNIATAISNMWHEKLGADVKLVNLSWKPFLETRGSQSFDMARAGWCGDYNEASTFLDLVKSTSGYNDAKYSNATVDELLSTAKFMRDPHGNYLRVEQILADEMPIIPIYHYSGSMMLNPAMMNWPVNNVQQYWYSRNLYKINK